MGEFYGPSFVVVGFEVHRMMSLYVFLKILVRDSLEGLILYDILYEGMYQLRYGLGGFRFGSLRRVLIFQTVV